MKDYDQQINDIVEAMDIPSKDYELMAGVIYENLKARIGLRISDMLDEKQLSELEETSDSDFFVAVNRLVPDIDSLIDEELDQIKREFTE